MRYLAAIFLTLILLGLGYVGIASQIQLADATQQIQNEQQRARDWFELYEQSQNEIKHLNETLVDPKDIRIIIEPVLEQVY